MIARRARHFAADARLGRDEPEAIGRLHEATGALGDVSSLSSLLPRVLDGALSLTGADFGTVQLLDPVTGSLRLVTQSGFDPGFCEYFAVVDDDHSACGRAARKGAQAVIADVAADTGFAPHRGIAAAAGFRAVQSTPLADEAGHLVGVVSTHFARPHRPADLDLRIMELYADVAGQAIAAHLGAPGDDGLDDPVGRAESLGHEPGPAREEASPDDTMTQLAEHIVNRLFSIGLSLDSARSIVREGPGGDRVATATSEVDRLIREIRDYVFAERGQGTLAGLPGKSRLDDQEGPAQAVDRAVLLHEHMVRTARALQASAAGHAALLERRADRARPPSRMDYRAEIKRWRAYADQAGQMAERWEQSPLARSSATVCAIPELRVRDREIRSRFLIAADSNGACNSSINGRQQLSATADYARRIGAGLGYVRPEKRTARRQPAADAVLTTSVSPLGDPACRGAATRRLAVLRRTRGGLMWTRLARWPACSLPTPSRSG